MKAYNIFWRAWFWGDHFQLRRTALYSTVLFTVISVCISFDTPPPPPLPTPYDWFDWLAPSLQPITSKTEIQSDLVAWNFLRLRTFTLYTLGLTGSRRNLLYLLWLFVLLGFDFEYSIGKLFSDPTAVGECSSLRYSFTWAGVWTTFS